ncbi:MAG: M48 family metallopeptidase [Nevskia sp.]|nr:M48 family metallopeptidase [Nevskia sp.]
MDFFQQQAKVRGHSRWLLLLFLLAVLGIVGAIDAVVAAALAYAQDPHDPPLDLRPILFGTSLAVLGVIAVATLYRMVSLDGGGAVVARSLGATLVPPETGDAAQRRLRNVVEEIAIASGVPVPQIFVLEQESGINAFAAGYSPADAAVTVTRGALDKLSRDELQGVIAHEFSHILNGDMRLNIRLMGLLFGILVLGVVGGKILQYGPGDRRGGAPLMVVALGLFAIGYIGVFFCRLIKAGISRQREYLADASAVQFTRQAGGIAGALKKVAGINQGSRLHSTHGEEVAHMLFGDGLGYSALFATHPPVLKRIKLLDPDFNPLQLATLAGPWNEPGYAPDGEEHAVLADFAGSPAPAAAPSPPPLPPAGAALDFAPAALAARVAQPGTGHYDCAAVLHQALPPTLLDAAHDQDRAVPLICALLLDPAAEAVCAAQLQVVAKDFGAACAEAAAALRPQLQALHPAQRLPLADIAMPSLRRLPRERLLQLVRTVVALTYADGQVAVFEWCLGRVLRMHIGEVLQPAKAGAPGRRKLDSCSAEVGVLLSVVAEFGQDDEASAESAFRSGTKVLPLSPPPGYNASDSANWPTVLDQALRTLDELEPPAKAALLQALGATIVADGKVTLEEAELLRAVCAGLHCPLPPLLADAA